VTDNMLVGARVLVVEDEYMIAMLLESLLEELGCVVADTASNPARALEIIASTAIDAAVLDVALNGADSFGVAEALAARNTPFVFATGYGGSRLPPQFAKRPVLQKPYRIGDLEQALKGILQR